MKPLKMMLMLGLSCVLDGCGPPFDRYTVVYGAVADEKGMPADSILVSVYGHRFAHDDKMKDIYTDKNGYYEAELDVSLKYGSLTVGVSIDYNSKYEFHGDHRERIIIGDIAKRDFRLLLK